MKKNLTLCLFLMMGIGISLHAKKVEISEAKVVGKNFFYQRINLHHNIPYGSLAIVGEFTEKKNGIPLYYLFNLNSNGYIIIAADDAVFPVIGYSFETSFTKENPSPEFMFWMEHYKDQISEVIKRNLHPDAEIRAAWVELSRADTPQ